MNLTNLIRVLHAAKGALAHTSCGCNDDRDCPRCTSVREMDKAIHEAYESGATMELVCCDCGPCRAREHLRVLKNERAVIHQRIP